MGTLVDLARAASNSEDSKTNHSNELNQPTTAHHAPSTHKSEHRVLPRDLERRIEFVAKFHGFTTHDLTEAKEIAAGDIENAIPCFRALLADIVAKNGTH